MKPIAVMMWLVTGTAVLLCVVGGVRLHGQEVPQYCGQDFCISKTDINFGNIVLNVPSLIEDISFQNNTGQAVSVAVNVTGPFTITTNACQKGARAHSHCNIYVEYTSTELQEFSGSLTVNYGTGSFVVTLEGAGVADDSNMRIKLHPKLGAEILTKDGLNWIPDGELMYLSCWAHGEKTPLFSDVEALKDNWVWFNEPPPGYWSCQANYLGDEWFSAVSSNLVTTYK